MALWLMEYEPRDYQFVCTPTGDELPEMIAHWKRLGDLLGKPILPVTNGVGLSMQIERERALPSFQMRWCTRKLKLEPYYRWLRQQLPCVSYVGLRADEEERQGMIFDQGNGIALRFPLREAGFTEADVWAYLDMHGVTIPARTDCARCYHQTLGEWWRLWSMYPEIYAEAEAQEAWVSEIHGKRVTFRNASRDTWPAGLADLRAKFEAGKVPPRTVRQIDMFTGERRKMSGLCRVCSL